MPSHPDRVRRNYDDPLTTWRSLHDNAADALRRAWKRDYLATVTTRPPTFDTSRDPGDEAA